MDYKYKKHIFFSFKKKLKKYLFYIIFIKFKEIRLYKKQFFRL